MASVSEKTGQPCCLCPGLWMEGEDTILIELPHHTQVLALGRGVSLFSHVPSVCWEISGRLSSLQMQVAKVIFKTRADLTCHRRIQQFYLDYANEDSQHSVRLVQVDVPLTDGKTEPTETLALGLLSHPKILFPQRPLASVFLQQMHPLN